jgi:hypothetical protein
MNTLTNRYRLSRHRGIPRYVDVHLRAILQVRLLIISSHLPIHKPRTHHFLQIRSLLHGLNRLWRVFSALTLHQHSSLFCFSNLMQLTHSVSRIPGSTALILILGPCVCARPFIRCSCAALVTLYGRLLPPGILPAMLELIMNTPPSGLALKVVRAARRMKNGALTFTAKQVSQSSTVGALRSAYVENRVYPWWVVSMFLGRGGRHKQR